MRSRPGASILRIMAKTGFPRRGGKLPAALFRGRLAVLLAAAFLALPAGVAGAQSRGGFAIYVGPVIGGSPEDREFFIQNMQMELRGAHYRVSETEEGADYFFSLILEEDENDPSAPGYILTLVLIDHADNNEIIRFSWAYGFREEMYDWNLYLVYQALANLPIEDNTAAAGAVRELPLEDNTAAADAVRELPPGENGGPPPREKRLYLGLRPGFLMNFFSGRKTAEYEAGQSQAFGFEGALVADLRLFFFFSLQAEAVFTVDTFSVGKQTARDAEYVYSNDSFTTFSLVFPLLVKLSLRVENSVLSFYGGAYYVLFLKTERDGGPGDITMTPPLGLTLGADLSFRAGSGEFFMDLRYSADLGATRMGNTGEVSYTRQRGGVSVGYKIGFWDIKKREKRIAEDKAAENRTEGDGN